LFEDYLAKSFAFRATDNLAIVGKNIPFAFAFRAGYP
jgi:phage gpG-like protein